jgi:hypothetical protein
MALELSTIWFTNQDDIVPASGVQQIFNTGIANTLDGNDMLTGTGAKFGFVNYGTLNTGSGRDIITGTCTDNGYTGINNASGATINTGEGNDIIISNGVLYNDGNINTGNGNDSIIASRGLNGDGRVYLGDGEDYIKTFGKGGVVGGNGNDILELTPGSYTVAIWGRIAVGFTKNGISMLVDGFEQLKAGSTMCDFTTLRNGQTIVVT